MTTALNTQIAQARVIELRRVAQLRRRPEYTATDRPVPTAVTLRLAQAGEADLVRRLAALDAAPELVGRVLLALVDGEPVAALSLYDRRVVANPFVATSDAVALLRLRAEHLLGAAKRRRLLAVPRLRVA